MRRRWRRRTPACSRRAAAPGRGRSSQCRATSWERKYGPLRFTAISSSKLSSVASRMSARTRGAMPALLTRASSRPSAASVSSTMRRRSSALRDVARDTSANCCPAPRGRARGRRPASPPPPRGCCRSGWPRQAVAASACAMPRPRPRLAPVTRAAAGSGRGRSWRGLKHRPARASSGRPSVGSRLPERPRGARGIRCPDPKSFVAPSPPSRSHPAPALPPSRPASPVHPASSSW